MAVEPVRQVDAELAKERFFVNAVELAARFARRIDAEKCELFPIKAVDLVARLAGQVDAELAEQRFVHAREDDG